MKERGDESCMKSPPLIALYLCLYFLWLGSETTVCWVHALHMQMVAWTETISKASTVSTFFYGVWNLLSGFIITEPQIPGWWIWFMYLAPSHWSFYVSSNLSCLRWASGLTDVSSLNCICSQCWDLSHLSLRHTLIIEGLPVADSHASNIVRRALSCHSWAMSLHCLRMTQDSKSQ